MIPEIDMAGDGVCMVMAFTTENPVFEEMGRFAAEVNREYCRRHGYGFRLYTSGFAEDRHPSWSKILFVKDALKSYPWAMWVDADAIITNHDITLDRFMDDRYMLVAGKQNWNELPWNSVNFGVFLARKTPDLDEFFDRVWADLRRPGRVGWEQDGVRKVMGAEPFRSRVKVVCRRDFNSLVYDDSLGLHSGFKYSTEVWTKGDFMAHYGWRRADVLGAMKDTLKECGWVMPEMKKIGEINKMVFVCNGHNPSSIRWALEYLRDALLRAGTDVKIVDLGRGGTEADCEGADVVMVYRCVDPKTMCLMQNLRRKGVFVMYFLDDYIFQMNCKYGGTVSDWMAPVPFMREADCLVSSSEFLLSKMPGSMKILRRTVLGPEGMELSKQTYRRGKTFSVALTAGRGRKNWTDKLVSLFLAEISEMLLPKEKMVFHYFGEARFQGTGKVSCTRHDYIPTESWQDWCNALKEMDLGVIVNPLEEDDDWCHCKSELKFVEAGAMGVPIVTSRVHPFTELIREGENGFLASTPREFARKVLHLLRYESLSRRVSAAVRKQIEEEYDADKNADKFIKDMRRVMERLRWRMT